MVRADKTTAALGESLVGSQTLPAKTEAVVRTHREYRADRLFMSDHMRLEQTTDLINFDIVSP